MSSQQADEVSSLHGCHSPEGERKDDAVRETWGNKLEFLLSLLSFAIGYGNIWRFPYLCYKNGGAAFLIPYILMIFLVGLPISFTEVAIGQYASLGPTSLFPKMAPILSGLGWGMVMIPVFTQYYNVIIAWAMYYTVASFSSVLPWSNCNNDYNSVECYTDEAAAICKNSLLFYYNKTCVTADQYCSVVDLAAHNQTHCHHPTEGALSAKSIIPKISPSEDFFLNEMLMVKGKSWDDFGGLRWELVGYLALSWIIVWACLYKGVKSLGKVVYFTSVFPYIVLLILLIRGITLEGAYQGIEFYILRPNITKLMEVEVWGDAAIQILFSNGLCHGAFITLASYNKFNFNCMRHSVIVTLLNSCTSIFTGLVIFSILGFLANELGVQVEDVASSGSGLVFVVYPAGLALLPIPHLWSVLFFLMIIIVGLGTVLALTETVSTAVFEQFESLRDKKPIVVGLVCFVMFLSGLSFCFEGGIFMFELFFWYSASFSLIAMAIVEVLGIHYIYGHKSFLRNVKEMDISLSFLVRCYWTVSCLITSPVCLVIIGFTSIYFFVPAYWGDYVFPERIQTLGWLLSTSSMGFIPLGALYACCRIKKLKDLFKPMPDFCPASERKSGVFRHTYQKKVFDDGNDNILGAAMNRIELIGYLYPVKDEFL